MRAFVAMMAMGCATAPTMQRPPPAPVLQMASGALLGRPLTVRISGAAPGDAVRLGVSTVGTGGGPCPPSLSSCLDLQAPLLVASEIADSAGLATITLTLPQQVPASTVWFQAAAGAEPSNTVEVALAPDDLWTPAPGTSWQWQLQGTLDTSVDVEMYDVDLFDTSASVINQLHADGRVVVCYFSAGSREDWRSDAADFPVATIGNPLGGWPGETWIDYRDATVRQIMADRLDLAAARNCDAVEPDNVDGYTNNPGFALTAADQLDYNRFLAEEAHARGLSVGLKNDVDQVAALERWFDWALNEECLSYNECGRNQPFLTAGKAVFHVEYADRVGLMAGVANQVCGQASGHDTLVKTWDLGAERIDCATW